MTKLTLSVDEAVVAKAKRLAEANETSVSAMFSHFVTSLDAATRRPRKLGPLTRKATGLIDLPAGADYKELLADALCERHGADR